VELLVQQQSQELQQQLEEGQRLEMGQEELPVYGAATPPWLHPRGAATILAEPRCEDGVVALALAMRTPADPSPKIKGTLYGIEGIAPGYLKGRLPWEDVAGTSGASGEDEARTSGGDEAEETGT
jgi:hypothetical protein